MTEAPVRRAAEAAQVPASPPPMISTSAVSSRVSPCDLLIV
ncbi:hypothetical protein X737_38600 [Mesorhizobium sp. L48C026A00]|nr:hypothetical protein X737_38600 [Mesorhizobium sp. L48C026A00]